MVLRPAGAFLMGSAEGDREAYDDEKPQRRVHVDAFYLGKYPITNEQYRVFVQKTGHREPYHWKHWKDGFPREKTNPSPARRPASSATSPGTASVFGWGWRLLSLSSDLWSLWPLTL